jgi:hypothetical protein
MAANEIDLIVEADGTVSFVYSDDAAVLFGGEAVTTRRASHVEPTSDGRWTADLGPVGGPVLGPFALRQDALDAEIDWLGDAIERGRLANG